MLEWLEIRTRTDLASARQQARSEAVRAGLSAERSEEVAIVASELASNILRYAGTGRILAQRMPQPTGSALALIAADEGPGIADLDRMRQDRITGGSGAGIGIGAVERLSDAAEVVTGPGGTIWACSFRAGEAGRAGQLDIAGLRIAYPAEARCGDAWATTADTRGDVRLVLVDGMGHGAKAADAGEAMAEGASASPLGTPKRRIEELVETFRSTRGGVISILDMALDSGRLRYGNLGNISAFRLRRGEHKRLVNRDGYVGSPSAHPMEEELDLQVGDLVVLHSDGLRSVDSAGVEALEGRGALMAAALLLSRPDRIRRDDVSVAVVRWPLNP